MLNTLHVMISLLLKMIWGYLQLRKLRQRGVKAICLDHAVSKDRRAGTWTLVWHQCPGSYSSAILLSLLELHSALSHFGGNGKATIVTGTSATVLSDCWYQFVNADLNSNDILFVVWMEYSNCGNAHLNHSGRQPSQWADDLGSKSSSTAFNCPSNW